MPLDLTEHELVLARVRLKTCIEKQLTASPEDWLSYERAITHYLRLIASFDPKECRERWSWRCLYDGYGNDPSSE